MTKRPMSPRDFSVETELVAALRDRDNDAFTYLIDRYHAPLTRLALAHVPSRAIADEVVQETWIGVLRGIERFEGRSSLSTWMFRILLNIARTRGVKEHRSIPFAALSKSDDEPAVTPERFYASGVNASHWSSVPFAWHHLPEDRLLAAETMAQLEHILSELPPQQREVLAMRDILGLSSEEICNALDITETNQRVLLHRARSKTRAALEQYFEGADQ